MNITLSAPAETIHVVRDWAHHERTSLNQYIRDMLENKARQILDERRAAADGFAAFLDSVRVEMPDGWRFDREEANAR